MFERLSERGRQVVAIADAEARALSHDYLGTEHLLIALLREDGGVSPAVLARSAFDPRRTGDLSPIEIQLLAYLVLAEREPVTSESDEDFDSLAVALACDLDEVRVAVISLKREGLLVLPMGDDEERVALTAAGAERVDAWLHRTASLFGAWPSTVPGVDDV